MKFCSNCGSQLDDSTQFCPNCGAAQPAPAANPNASAPNYSAPQGNYGNPGYSAPQGNYNNPGYSAPQGYGNASYTSNINRTPVKTDYSLVMYILLTIVTCGIYGYYTIYKLAQDVNQICAEDGDSVGGLGMYILLSIVTCGFYSYYWMYKIQNRLHNNAPRYNVSVPENGTTVLMWLVFGSLLCGVGSFIGYHIVFKSANAVGLAYNNRFFYGQGR